MLHSPSTSHLVPVLRSLFQEHYCLDDVDHAVPLSAPSGMVYYVCKKCYRALESYTKAKVALVEGIVRVGDKLGMRSASLPVDGLVCTATADITSTPNLPDTPKRKRRLEQVEPLPKRMRLETPVREAASRMHAVDSPLVTHGKYEFHLTDQRLARSMSLLVLMCLLSFSFLGGGVTSLQLVSVTTNYFCRLSRKV